MTSKTCGIALLSVILIPFSDCSSLAGGRSRIDVSALCTNASVVVVGRVDSVKATDNKIRLSRFNREYDLGLWQAVLDVKQVIKGVCGHEQVLVDLPGPVKGQNGGGGILGNLESFKSGEIAVVFLNEKDPRSGSYSLASNYRSIIHIANSPVVTRLLNDKSSSDTPKQRIASLLTTSLSVCPSEMIDETLSDLVDVEGEQAIVPINAFLDTAKDAAVRAKALVALFRLGDYSRLAEGVELLKSDQDSGRAVLNAKANLSSQMSFVTNAEVVMKYYIPLLRHPSASIRQNAFYAVRMAKTRVAVPELIKGIHDSDRDSRYQCLMGLAEILGRTGEWAPSKELFETNETEYISRWEKWWEQSGRSEFVERPGMVFKTPKEPMLDDNTNRLVEAERQYKAIQAEILEHIRGKEKSSALVQLSQALENSQEAILDAAREIPEFKKAEDRKTEIEKKLNKLHADRAKEVSLTRELDPLAARLKDAESAVNEARVAKDDNTKVSALQQARDKASREYDDAKKRIPAIKTFDDKIAVLMDERDRLQTELRNLFLKHPSLDKLNEKMRQIETDLDEARNAETPELKKLRAKETELRSIYGKLREEQAAKQGR